MPKLQKLLTGMPEFDLYADIIRQEYEQAFPREERRPWSSLVACNDSAKYALSLFGFVEGDELLGFVTVWDFDTFVYIEHFAVVASQRRLGWGAQMLRNIAELAGGKPIVLEVEPEGTTPQSTQRIEFYRRNGFTDYPEFSYVQPPYANDLPAVELTLMVRGDVLEPQLSVFSSVLHRNVYDKLLF